MTTEQLQIQNRDLKDALKRIISNTCTAVLSHTIVNNEQSEVLIASVSEAEIMLVKMEGEG